MKYPQIFHRTPLIDRLKLSRDVNLSRSMYRVSKVHIKGQTTIKFFLCCAQKAQSDNREGV